jgi:hypothetical protein
MGSLNHPFWPSKTACHNSLRQNSKKAGIDFGVPKDQLLRALSLGQNRSFFATEEIHEKYTCIGALNWPSFLDKASTERDWLAGTGFAHHGERTGGFYASFLLLGVPLRGFTGLQSACGADHRAP